MKRTLIACLLGMFAVGIVGCHASVDAGTDDTNSSHYKKTSTTDGGTKTTKTETKVEKSY